MSIFYATCFLVLSMPPVGGELSKQAKRATDAKTANAKL